MTDLFEWLVQPSLDFVRRNCQTFITTSDMHMVLTLMRLYSALMDEIIETVNTVPVEGEEPKQGQLTPQQVLTHSSYQLSPLIVLQIKKHTSFIAYSDQCRPFRQSHKY